MKNLTLKLSGDSVTNDMLIKKIKEEGQKFDFHFVNGRFDYSATTTYWLCDINVKDSNDESFFIKLLAIVQDKTKINIPYQLK